MTTTYDAFNARLDPIYDEIVAHLQAAEWQEAIRKLEALQAMHPEDEWVARRLEEARLKARLDVERAVRPKSTINFARLRPILARIAFFIILVVFVVLIVQVIQVRLAPILAEARINRELATLMRDARAFYDGGKLDLAEEKLLVLTGRVPDYPGAVELLGDVRAQREKLAVCAEADALYNSDNPEDWARAIPLYQDFNNDEGGYCNAGQRVPELTARLQTRDVAAQADAAYVAGDCGETARLYETLRTLDGEYEREKRDARLYECYLSMGKEIVNTKPPAPERIAEALDDFTRALAVRPRDGQAQAEQRLANLFLAGQQAADRNQLVEAVSRWESVYQARGDYLGGILPPRLFEMYLRLGDDANGRGDCGLAYDYFRRAAALPGMDKSAALNRQDQVRNCLTPTPTPSVTPTPTMIPTPTAYIYRPPTEPPPATPAPPLLTFKGQIVFRSAHPQQPGFWVMNPDGSKKRYLGDSEKLQSEYNAIYDKEHYSPDGRYRVYALKNEHAGDLTVQVYYQGQDRDGYTVTKRVTNCSKICYDPVWAPDGSRIAFVSPEWESDDIWVINPDGSEWWNYTPNKWEWEKHPSWSPDSRKITFWSNREGTKQIYVIDANGQNLKKISGDAAWDEYDPLWIK